NSNGHKVCKIYFPHEKEVREIIFSIGDDILRTATIQVWCRFLEKLLNGDESVLTVIPYLSTKYETYFLTWLPSIFRVLVIVKKSDTYWIKKVLTHKEAMKAYDCEINTQL